MQFCYPNSERTVKCSGKAEVVAEEKLDSMGLLIQSSVPVLRTSALLTAFTSPHPLFLGFLHFSEVMWFLLINPDSVL